jgi:hypothetical protein
VIEIAPLLVVAPDTLRAAKFVPLPVRPTVPLLTKELAVTESDDERLPLPMERPPVGETESGGVGQHAADVQARSAEAGIPVEENAATATVDERPGRRHRGTLGEIETARDVSEARQCAVRAQDRAALDEGVVPLEGQLRTGGDRADLPVKELDRGVLEEIHANQARLDVTTGVAGFGKAGTVTGIVLNGSDAHQALLDMTTGVAGFGTAGTLTGSVALFGDCGIEFLSGQISTIAASSQLQLEGNNAFVADAGKLTSNSALTGLADVAGALDLVGAAVSTTGALDNDGTLQLYQSATLSVGGVLTNTGTLTMGGYPITALCKLSTTALTNTGSINIGSLTSKIALIDVTAGAAGFGTPGTLTGSVGLSDNSAIEFAKGQIRTIAASSQLSLTGNNAFIEDSTTLGSNSALTGLTDIAGALTLDQLASVSIAGALTNAGALALDQGASASIAGALTNTGTLEVSEGGELTAETLSNSGSIQTNSSEFFDRALLDVTTGAAGFGTAETVTGTVVVNGYSAIEFLSGQISTIGASSTLTLNGNSAFIEDSAVLGSNSALTGLSNVSGALDIDNGAAVSTTGAVANSGLISLAGAGSTLSIAGALTNTGVISIASDTETLAGAVGGKGSFSLSGANLQFDSRVSAGQTINESGADALFLEEAQKFAGTIKIL